jgi:hypothetical protein
MLMSYPPIDMSEVWIGFAGTYLLRMIVWVAVTLGLCLISVLCKRHFGSNRLFTINIAIVVLSLIALTAYFAWTAKWTFTKIALDAEDSAIAEWAYQHIFELRNIDEGMKLAMNKKEWQTVRFYAACRVADILATNDDQAVDLFLGRIRGGDPIAPCFFGTNAINSEFFITGHIAGPYDVKDLIVRRIRYVRSHGVQ